MFVFFKQKSKTKGCHSLNVNMALFASDLLCVYDRGVICDLLVQHFDEFSTQISMKRAQNAAKESSTLTLMMLDFYKLVSDHESFVQINLPKRIEIVKVMFFFCFF